MVKFSTKAQTLAALHGKLKRARILDQIAFTVAEWQQHPTQVLKKVEQHHWLQKDLIVRSSALAEDKDHGSLAGHFLSIHNVRGKKATSAAIEEVIQSFTDQDPKNQVFIQPQLQNVRLSGVLFTRDPSSGAPYYVINYDDSSADTASVTSGKTNRLKTWHIHRLAQVYKTPLQEALAALAKELESLFHTDALDIEFAVDAKEDLYLFQVRPLVIRTRPAISDEAHLEAVQRIGAKVANWQQRHPHLCGEKTVFGIMPDWNPAEIIGVRPTPLALSLYREVITDCIWAYQRDRYGYRNLRSFPLIVEFEGLPYIDVRVSFNSFIPASLPDELATKLANYYLDKLVRHPEFHDKVEFEILFTCYDFDMQRKLALLDQEGFSLSEREAIQTALRDLTNAIIGGPEAIWKTDLQKIAILEAKRTQVLASDLDDAAKLYWLIEDCKRYGTLPFAGLARAAFIAVQILKSLVATSIISQREYDLFLASIKSVSSEMVSDFNTFSRTAFLEKYGHLRPGTYDILSRRYDEAPEYYFKSDLESPHKPLPHKAPFQLSLEKLRAIQSAIEKEGIQADVLTLLEFIKSAIEAREFSKFTFTRSLSDFLKLYQTFAHGLGISREEAAFSHVSTILSLNTRSLDAAKTLRESIERGREAYKKTQCIHLPPLITQASDAFAFASPTEHPNFITHGKVAGEVVHLENNQHLDVNDKILFIPSADPGYDWIFSHAIRGFVTQYGGVNSHMAIRAAELEIPAVIGAGNHYNQWRNANLIEINCLNRSVCVLR